MAELTMHLKDVVILGIALDGHLRFERCVRNVRLRMSQSASCPLSLRLLRFSILPRPEREPGSSLLRRQQVQWE